MNVFQTVTSYYTNDLPHIKSHRWEVRVREEDSRLMMYNKGDHTLNILLWDRKTRIVASVYLTVVPTDTTLGVKRRVYSIGRDIQRLLEITPKPVKGYYLKHTNYDWKGDTWRTTTSSDRHVYEKDFEYRYNIKTIDFEDLEHEFKELLSKGTTAKGLPAFVTGIK